MYQIFSLSLVSKAKKIFRDDKDSYGKPKATMSKIDKIFDDFDNIEDQYKELLECIQKMMEVF